MCSSAKTVGADYVELLAHMRTRSRMTDMTDRLVTGAQVFVEHFDDDDDDVVIGAQHAAASTRNFDV